MRVRCRSFQSDRPAGCVVSGRTATPASLEAGAVTFAERSIHVTQPCHDGVVAAGPVSALGLVRRGTTEVGATRVRFAA